MKFQKYPYSLDPKDKHFYFETFSKAKVHFKTCQKKRKIISQAFVRCFHRFFNNAFSNNIGIQKNV